MQPSDPRYRPGTPPGNGTYGPYQPGGAQGPYGNYSYYNPVPPFNPYEAERRRERGLVRSAANRFYAMMILAIVAAGAASVIFWAPAHIADWINGTSRAEIQFNYGWGIVLTQVLPLLLGELVLLLLAWRFLDGGFRPREIPPASVGRKVGISALGGLAGAGAGMLGSLSVTLAALPLSLLGINLSAGSLALPTQTGPRTAVLLFTLLLSPVLEELIFRGVFLNNLCRYGERFAIVSSALMFAFFNFRFDGLVYSLLIGLVMGCLAVRIGNIWLVAGARVLSGLLIAMVQISLSGSGGWSAPGWMFVLAMIVLAAGMILAFVFTIFYLIAAGNGSKGEAPMIGTSRRIGASLSGTCAILGIILYILFNFSRIIGSSAVSVL